MTLCPLQLEVSAFEWDSPYDIDVDLVKLHCAIDDDRFDAILPTWIRAAVEWAEGAMHRTVFSRSHTWVLKDFPRDGLEGIRLPRGKTRSVESVSYVSGGQTYTLTGPSSGSPAGTGYQESLIGDDGGWIIPPRGTSWPSVDCDAPAPVTISFTAGWIASEVPSDIIHAIMFAVADCVDVRGTPDLNAHGGSLDAREALVSPYRLVRWY